MRVSSARISGGSDSESIVFSNAQAHVYRKLVLRGGRLAGAVMVGDARDAAWYQELIASGSDVAAMRGRLVFGRALAQAA